ncbi:MAG: 2-oxoglutarate dehydrogenase E1 component, partial [Proteobacteria bacterium]|nr:2-oxoglutarate dehydrogenase E1 component [Pseudomonadota bacterium]
MSITEGDQSTIETSGAQGSYLESLYELYLQDHASVPDDWRLYFDSLPVIQQDHPEISHKEAISRITNKQINAPLKSPQLAPGQPHDKQVKVIQLIQAYRNRGHQKANLDPLGLKPIRHSDNLELAFHQLDNT